MARRRSPQQHRYSVPVVEQPSITPDSGIRVTLKQALIAVGVILGAGGGYGALKWDQAETRKDVAAIKEAQKSITATTTAALKDQEEKRNLVTKEQEERRRQLGESFLASNKEIATKVGDLATAVAVQQAQFKATSDALVKISDQLQQLNASSRSGAGAR